MRMQLEYESNYPLHPIETAYLTNIPQHIKNTMPLKYVGDIFSKQCEPSQAPIACPSIIATPMRQAMWPAMINTIKDAILVAKFNGLAFAVD